eukprot:TRINITY_DN77472_c0_g1_i1.p1 TRINITY_DN77472_c0_g1~~TRINITY_DN77472_c0_g1_i1.p1  ORF type:complete len:403 (+),score=77.56 TRINITY_DN77472_c0_g1_i1:164-1210(+)
MGKANSEGCHLREGGYAERRSTRAVTLPPLQKIQMVGIHDFSPDVGNPLGAGGYGSVFPVRKDPSQVVKVFSKANWPDVVKESSFAQAASARSPHHYVQCLGIGSMPPGTRYSAIGDNFAVMQRAEGISLASAGHRNGKRDGIETLGQALEVLEKLATIMANMRKPCADGKLHFHLDLKPDNIMISKVPGQAIKVTVIDYGIVTICQPGDPAVQDSMFQLYRWLGWEFLWTIASEHFQVQRENPWEQLPEGFQPFFKPSSMRMPGYMTAGISEQMIDSSMRDAFFNQLVSPAFRSQWNDSATAKGKLGKLVGKIFFGVARASDRLQSFDPDLTSVIADLQELRKLAKV